MRRLSRKRVFKLGLVFFVALGLTACAFMPDFPRAYKSGKYDPVEAQPAGPAAAAATPVAEKQTEPHTCGWHATRSLYTAYGMDPSRYKLRFRLGTDEPAMRADRGSTGTLHPDLYRVLAQDGFTATPVALGGRGAAGTIDGHLAGGQLALAVVYRGTYHWVLLAGVGEAGRLSVVDSLADGPEATQTRGFLDEALSVTLVAPAGEAGPVDVADAHAAGLAEMARLYQRR